MLEIKPTINALLRSKAGAILAILQLTLTLAIVSNALSIIKDRVEYLDKPTGYPEESVFKFNILTFEKDVDLNQQWLLDERAVRAIPGVIDVTGISSIPLVGGGSSTGFRLKPAPQESKTVGAGWLYGNHQIINTLGVEISEGRSFTEEDVTMGKNYQNQPTVAIVSRPFTDDMFGEGKGLGEIVYLGSHPLKIIGIVETMVNQWPKRDNASKLVIMPMIQAEGMQKFVVRTDPARRDEVMKKIEAALLKGDTKRVVSDITGLDEKKANYNAKDTLMLRMLYVLVFILLLVTALGIFGLTQFNISKRTKQIGTRRALGARKSAIIRYFVVENMLVCSVGLVLGSIAAYFLGKKLMSLYSVPALEPSFVVLTCIGLIALSVLAVIYPAKSAADISPSIATRSV
ncbi:ABC transporter permease (plasmid) [Pseudoalteromonas sp. T1lg65]|uniref:ABC transporter permease n=1 Tax=Pseudoalteromonas sp. T1lg65 TaxID=2077101 RepID=UPI003F78EC26